MKSYIYIYVVPKTPEGISLAEIVSFLQEKEIPSYKLPEEDILWIRSWTGVLHPKPWAIKIIAELDEVLPGRPQDETLSQLLK